MKPARRGARTRSGLTFLLVGVIATSLLATLGFGQALVSALGPSNHGIAGDHGAAALRGLGYNSTPCGLFASVYNGSGLSYYENFTIMFSKLCQTPPFVSIYEGMGPTGFFGVGWGGTIGALPNLSFSLYWEANCTNASDGLGNSQCTHQADWIGNLTNNSVTGPFVREYSVMCMCGPVLVKDPPLSSPAAWFAPGILGSGAPVAIAFAIVARGRRPPPTPPSSAS